MPLTAAELGTRYQGGSYPNFRGGVNNSISPELIADNELADARNLMPDKESAGVVIKRPGYNKALSNQQTERFRSIYQGYNGVYFTGVTLVKLAYDNTTLYTGSISNSWDWTSWSDTSVARDLFCNGVNNPQKTGGTAGTTTDILGSPPVLSSIEVYRNMVFGVVATGVNPNSILRWSDFGTFETWPAVNTLTIGRASNQLLNMTRYGDVLFLGAERSFYHIVGDHQRDIGISASSHEEGVASGRSVVATPYGLFWWSRSSGIVLSKSGLGGSDMDRPMLRKLSRTMRTFTDGLGDHGYIHGVWNPIEECVEFSIPNTSSNVIDLEVWYYPLSDSFWLQDGAGAAMSAKCFIYATVNSSVAPFDTNTMALGPDSTSGYLYQRGDVDDDGTAIRQYMETKVGSTEYGPSALKRIEVATPMYVGEGLVGLVTHSVYVDGDAEAQVIAADLDLSETADEPIDEPIGVGLTYHKLQHRLEDSALARTRIRGILDSGVVVST